MRAKLLRIYRDERGHLFEAFRGSVAMAYVVQTEPGHGRDLDRWHVHAHKAETFIPVAGRMHLAVKQGRDVTVYALNADHPRAVTVMPGEGHSVANLGEEPATLLVVCDSLYDPSDEGREPMENWSWDPWRPKPN